MSGEGAEFEFRKPMREVDAQLLEAVRKMYCAACGKGNEIHAHHVTSKGAGGGDTRDNVMPLCAAHHAFWHSKGVVETCKRFPGVLKWLHDNNRLEVFKRATSKRGNDGNGYGV